MIFNLIGNSPVSYLGTCLDSFREQCLLEPSELSVDDD